MSIVRIDNRWTRMDTKIQMQIDALMSAMRVKNLGKIADEADIGRSRFYDCYKYPSKFRLIDLRKLSLLSERYGLKFEASIEEARA